MDPPRGEVAGAVGVQVGSDVPFEAEEQQSTSCSGRSPALVTVSNLRAWPRAREVVGLDYRSEDRAARVHHLLRRR